MLSRVNSQLEHVGKPRPLLRIFNVFKLSQNKSAAGYLVISS